MQLIIQTMLPLIFLVILGSILKKSIADNSWTDVLNKLAIYLLFPALIFSGMMKIKLESINDFSFIYENFLILISIILILYFGLKILGFKESIVNTYIISVFFGNVGYLGFPIISTLIIGSEGLVSIHVAIYTLILFTLGISILEFSAYKKLNSNIFINALKNPLLLAVIFSVILLISNIKLPYIISKTIDLLAGGATPIILISLGIFLARELPKVEYKHVIWLVILKLFLMPSIFLICFYIAGQTEALTISVLEAGMPMAITPFILAEIYPMEKEIIAISIVISSILSVVTLPLLIISIGVV